MPGCWRRCSRARRWGWRWLGGDRSASVGTRNLGGGWWRGRRGRRGLCCSRRSRRGWWRGRRGWWRGRRSWWCSRRGSVPGILRKHFDAPRRSGRGDERDADVGEVAENVGAVPRRVHPGSVHCWCTRLTLGDILAERAPARRNLACEVGIVGHRPVGCHLVRPAYGDGIQLAVAKQASLTIGGPRLIHQGGDRVGICGCGAHDPDGSQPDDREDPDKNRGHHATYT